MTGKEQLNARLVCKHWNKLLCDCRRLLQTTVGVSLDLTAENEARQRALEIISSLPSSSAVKVYKVSVGGGYFEQSLWYPREHIMEPEQYFEPFSFDHVEELTYTFNHRNKNLTILNLVMGKMSQLKILTITIIHETIVERALQNAELDHVTYGSVEKLIIERFEYADPLEMWSEITFNNMSYLCDRLPNLKSIVGVPGSNDRFYEKFGQMIECPLLEINDASLNILHNNDLKQLKELHLHQDISVEYDATSFWQHLNTNTTLETIRLVYHEDRINNMAGQPVTIPHQDYSKVTHFTLQCSFPIQHEFVQLIFEQFTKSISLEVHCEIYEDHFFGHETFQLPLLQTSSISLYNCLTRCDECLDSLMKSLTHVKSLRLSWLNSTIIQSIGKNIPDIRELHIGRNVFKPMMGEDCYMLWPLTKSLEEFVYPGKRCDKIEAMAHFCEMCPNLKRLELFRNEPFGEDILGLLLEKLKLLEYVKFKDCKYLVTVDGGKRCFEVVKEIKLINFPDVDFEGAHERKPEFAL